MTMPHKVRFALIGAGGIAQSYAQAFKEHPDAELVSMADVRFNAAQALAESVGNCQAFDRYPALVEGPDFDAVVVCTPPNSHEEVATRMLDWGKHVLCEKPFTISPNSARRMLAAATRAERTLTMASKFRYSKDIIAAKSMVTSNLIGDIVHFENVFTARVDMSRRWNADPHVAGGGVIIDNGAHSFDIARLFLGPIAEVHVVAGRRLQPIPVEDNAHIFFKAAAGTLGSVDLSWSLHKDREAFVELFGERGTIRVGWKTSRYKLNNGSEWIPFGSGYDKLQAFRDNLGNFARHLRDKEELAVSPDDALANVLAIDAAYKSVRKQHWVPLAEGATV